MGFCKKFTKILLGLLLMFLGVKAQEKALPQRDVPVMVLGKSVYSQIGKSGKKSIDFKKSVIPNEYLVVYKAQSSIDSILKSASLSTKDVSVKTLRSLSNTKHAFAILKVRNPGVSVMKLLSKDTRVLSISRNGVRKPFFSPNDANFTLQWALNNTGQIINGIAGTQGSDIGALSGWDMERGSSDVVVAVFDTGIDVTHADLRNNIWINALEANGSVGIDDDGNGYIDDVYGYDFGGFDGENDSDPNPIDPHGTHVAGVIGAEGNNMLGIAGVNHAVKILPVKIFRDSDLGAHDSDIIEAIDYVLSLKNQGVNITAINASYGGYYGHQGDPMFYAIQSLADSGIAFVVASGNDANNNDTFPSYPADYQLANVVSVGSVNSSDGVSVFSNLGRYSVDIFAPGENILSTTSQKRITPLDKSFGSDDVEGGPLFWIAQSPWAITATDSNSPSNSWSHSPNGDYASDANVSLTWGSDFNLSAAIGEDLAFGFAIKGSAEEGYDGLYVEFSADGGDSWSARMFVTGSMPSWQTVHFFIPENFKTESFRVRLRFVSDGLIEDTGYWVDDFYIGRAVTEDSYDFMDGTSIAAPFVTGAVALLSAYDTGADTFDKLARILQGAQLKALYGNDLYLRLSLPGMFDVLKRPYITNVSRFSGVKRGMQIDVSALEIDGSAQAFLVDANGTEQNVSTSWQGGGVRVVLPMHRPGGYLKLRNGVGESLNAYRLWAWNITASQKDPSRLQEGAAWALVGTSLYMLGGYDPFTYEPVRYMMRYDIRDESWNQESDILFDISYGDAIGSGDTIYLAGDSNASVLMYDTITKVWQTHSVLPRILTKPQIVALNEKLFAVDGASGEIYDYNGTEWSLRASAPQDIPLDSQVEVLGINDKLFVILYDSVVSYDLNSSTFSYETNLSVPPAYAHLTSEGKIRIYGSIQFLGENSVSGGVLVEYDPKTKRLEDLSGTIYDPGLLPPKEYGALAFYEQNQTVVYVGELLGYAATAQIKDNDVPLANDENISTIGSVTINVLANDSDPDGDTLRVVSITNPAHGTIYLESNQSITYTPNNGFVGADTFSYTIEDGYGGSAEAVVSIDVKRANTDPIAQDDQESVLAGTSVTINVLANDSDPDGDTLRVVSNTNPAHGTIYLEANQSITYTPNNGFVGADTFSYTIEDGYGGSAEAVVSIDVKRANTDPIAQDDQESVLAGTSVTINVLANDSDPDGDTLRVVSITNPAHGSVRIVGGKYIIYASIGAFTGVDTFSYTIEDGYGGSAEAHVSINVQSQFDSSDKDGEDEVQGGGGGCSYNPHAKSFDLGMVLLILLSLLYPMRRKSAHG